MKIELRKLGNNAICRSGSSVCTAKVEKTRYGGHIKRLDSGTQVLVVSMSSAGGHAQSCYCLPCANLSLKSVPDIMREISAQLGN